jgi:hypothetical protein
MLTHLGSLMLSISELCFIFLFQRRSHCGSSSAYGRGPLNYTEGPAQCNLSHVSRQSSEKWFKPKYSSRPLSSPREQLNKWYYKGKDRLPEYGSFPVILSPYSNRGERIGARISVYEERDREIIKYTCVINTEKRKRGPATILGLIYVSSCSICVSSSCYIRVLMMLYRHLWTRYVQSSSSGSLWAGQRSKRFRWRWKWVAL